MALLGAGLLILGLAAGVLLLPNLAKQIKGQPDYQSAIPYPVDYQAPNIELADLQGNPVSLAALKGQVVLVNLWATWCPPCKAEMPTLNAYYQDHRGENFVVVAIDDSESADIVQDFVTQQQLSFPVWADPDGRSSRAFQVNYLPTSFLIDPTGQVVLAWDGPITRQVLEEYVTPLLEE